MKKTLVLCLVSIILGLCNAAEYIPNTILLERDGKEVKWGQSTNEKGSCSPSYNALCPRTDNENNKDDCERMLAGCGAIAMAQIMWKWAYPDESRYGIYDWNKIPAALTDGCSMDCSLLIRNCGDACHMNYQSILGLEPSFMTGSWATISNIAKGFADFDYSARVVDLDDWKSYGDSWKDLIRSEIDCGRPVLMFGQHNIIDIKEKHYFVIDGYSMTDKNLFHVNWGWKGKYNDEIWDGYASFYNESQYCFEVTFKNSHGQTEMAKGYVVVHYGECPSNYDPVAHFPVSFEKESDYVSPKCSEERNHYLRFKVKNVDSYQCKIYNQSGELLLTNAGDVKGSYAYMWDGSPDSYYPSGSYRYEVTFKNYHGASTSTNGTVDYYPYYCPSDFQTDILTTESETNRPVISPNPTDENSTVTSDSKILHIEIFDVSSRLLLSETPNSNSYTIETNGFGKGLYLVRTTTEDGVYVDRLMVK